MNDSVAYLTDPADPSVRVRAVPPPWNLEGRGFILLYKFRPDFLYGRGFLEKGTEASLAGGIGAVMLVDYASSDAGPYGELLFIPGKLRLGGKRWNRITKIYVSTMDSVLNGRENWAIPKERADFAFWRRDGFEESIVSLNGLPFFRAAFAIKGPHFRVSTRLFPFPLLQGDEGAYRQTTFHGSGRGRLASLEKIEVDQAFFPDLSLAKPLAVIAVDPFRISFPAARR